MVGEDGRGRSLTARVAQLEAEIAGLRKALETRTVIGQATGLIAAVLECTPQDAFNLLVRMSQHQNVKLHIGARRLVAAFETTHRGDQSDPDAVLGQLLWERLVEASNSTKDSAGT
ncbi:ANTAR domain-containing protein [Umezawaea beigongshangensis]|uniref:ANTAR domain-containing protein n=1 Tax=Umezawaea beigongshangensis TaxID=2780383 RepID=UPI0018F26133|nr:ANTAR domain-containing protein [Umezawaea beigongshangensis]